MSVSMTSVMEVLHRYIPKDFSPRIGMILGSGLSPVADQIEDQKSIPYQAIPGLHEGNVEGHASLLIAGKLNGVPVICMKGRLHLYEGSSYESVRIFVRMLKHLGCHALLVTGAVGSMLEEAGPGELMMVTDHINFQPGNPLVGPNDASEGSRFFGMEDAYDVGLQDLMQTSADHLGITLHRGVYISTLGPSFETPAEIRAFKMWGAGCVGMSVVPEVLVARHCGLNVVSVCAVTNYAAGMHQGKITHELTLQQGEIASRKLTKLIPEFVKEATNAVV